MADQTLADQLLKAIQPLWGEEANAIRSTWTLSGMSGDDPELLEWLAGEIETLVVVPYLLQADIILSLGDSYPASRNIDGQSPTSFSIQLDDDVVVPLAGHYDGVETPRHQWYDSTEPVVELARSLKRLRGKIASAYDTNPRSPPENPITPPTKRSRRGGP